MDDWEVFPREAAAVAAKAVEQGVARRKLTYAQELKLAEEIIKDARQKTKLLMKENFIKEAPQGTVAGPECYPSKGDLS
jgi:malate dehydrogenase (oxaloacetate-decarboxylating)